MAEAESARLKLYSKAPLQRISPLLPYFNLLTKCFLTPRSLLFIIFFFFLAIFSRFILNLVRWLTSSRALFNAMRSLLSLDEVLMEEDLEVAKGG